jgi:hypothetical protein
VLALVFGPEWLFELSLNDIETFFFFSCIGIREKEHNNGIIGGFTATISKQCKRA